MKDLLTYTKNNQATIVQNDAKIGRGRLVNIDGEHSFGERIERTETILSRPKRNHAKLELSFHPDDCSPQTYGNKYCQKPNKMYTHAG